MPSNQVVPGTADGKRQDQGQREQRIDAGKAATATEEGELEEVVIQEGTVG
jgi:hypothetical protein